MDAKVIDNWFSHHPPTGEEQTAQFQQIRDGAKQFAHTINDLIPDCADKTAAIRKLRESMMTANAAIACGGK